MATRMGENPQPALRLAGRNSNPLVSNVFPLAFAIQNGVASDVTNGCKTVLLSYPAGAGPGLEPGRPGQAGCSTM